MKIQQIIWGEDDDNDIGVYEICPVCLETWGDLDHTVAYAKVPGSDPIRYELVCSRSADR